MCVGLMSVLRTMAQFAGASSISKTEWIRTGSEPNLKMSGPSIFVDMPKEVTDGQSRPGDGWGQSPREEQGRRSIYIKVKRSLITPLLESFDFAETDCSAPARFNTVQPTQALG